MGCLAGLGPASPERLSVGWGDHMRNSAELLLEVTGPTQQQIFTSSIFIAKWKQNVL